MALRTGHHSSLGAGCSQWGKTGFRGEYSGADQVVWGKGEAKLAQVMETGLQWVLQLKEQNGEEST